MILIMFLQLDSPLSYRSLTKVCNFLNLARTRVTYLLMATFRHPKPSNFIGGITEVKIIKIKQRAGFKFKQLLI